jgi:hypothetical protein
MGRLPGFCGPSYQSSSPNVDLEDAIDLFCERSESEGAKTPIALLQRPGLAHFASLGEPSVPWLFSVNGRTFAACSNLYEITAAGAVITLGSLGLVPVRPTQIIANETQLLVMNNGDLFVLTLATNAFAAVNMAQFNGPVLQIGFSDGYGIAVLQNSHTFQQSNLEDFTTWGGLNISTISYFPDNIQSMICDHREPWFFSGKKSLGYYNAGAGFPVFIPIQGAYIENGAGATFATGQLDNSVFWIDEDERGGRVARRLNGYSAQRVSTHAVEFAWSQYSTIADAVAYTYEVTGHAFWVILFPSANATWVYDVATNLWHKWAFWNTVSGTYSAHRSMSHTFNFGIHLVGDWASGTIYQLSPNFLTDFGNPIRRQRTTPEISKENQWVYFHEIYFDIDVGQGPQPPLVDGNGQPRPPQIVLEWSDDGGKTWSNAYTLNCGKAGEYNARAIKWQLGRARRRVFRVWSTDPVPLRFADAYINATPSVGDRP